MNEGIFVTGASGFIGSNLVRKLAENKTGVFALVTRPTKYGDSKITPVVGDILKPESFAPFLKKCRVVFHCAAHISFSKKDLKTAYAVNVEGTRNILEAAHRTGVGKFVHLSACAVLSFSSDRNHVLDETANPVIEEDNVYAYTKKMAEEQVQQYVRKGLDASIANIATVYGPGDRKLNSGSVIKAIYEGKLKVVPPGGTSFVAVEDVVNGLLSLARQGRPGERYIFCAENMEYADLAKRIAGALGVGGPKHAVPRFTYFPAVLAARVLEMFRGFSRNRVNLLTTQIVKEAYGYKYFSSEKAKRELGWRPQVSLEEAVMRAFAYYRARGLV